MLFIFHFNIHELTYMHMVSSKADRPTQIHARKRQEGTSLKDRLFAAALCEDGGFVLAGYSEGDWAAADAGAGGSDLIAVKLSPEGEVLWRWQVSYNYK